MARHVFFDLDGTLTDPKEGITRCIQHALHEMSFEAPPADELTWCIGPPLLGSFERLVGAARAAEGLALFRERFSTIGWQENVPYPEVHEALARLVEAGRSLYVATSKPHVYATRIVGHFNLQSYFTQIFGSELDGTRADKSELLAYALAQTQARDAVMIGDRSHDMVGAVDNAIPGIGVTYGYGTRKELEQAGAHHIVNSPRELADLLL